MVEDPREREYIISNSKSKISTMTDDDPLTDRRRAKQFVIENSTERADSDEELENELQ